VSSGPWLSRPQTIRKLWIVGSGLLAITVLVQLAAYAALALGLGEWIEIHPHFVFEGWPAFNAVFGFVSCVAIVLAAKVLGGVLKRRDDYYDD